MMIARNKPQDLKFARTLSRWIAISLLLTSAQAFAQSAGTVTYVYTDPQGTPLAEADASGNITATFDYTPYGSYAPQGTLSPGPAPTGPGYTGHVNDPETNLVYMQARYYDPETGRFLSVDPVGIGTSNTFNFSRFVYANNNPEKYTDPSGACVGGQNGSDSPCNPQPPQGSTPQPPPPPPPPVSPTVQRMRDTSDHRDGTAVHSKSEYSVSGLVNGTPSVSASGMAARGGGLQFEKGLYHDDEDTVSIVTPALGLTASVDVKIFELHHQGQGAIDSPVGVTYGGDISYHELLGGRLQFGYSPPTTFNLTLSGGAGLGAGFHFFSVDGKIKQ